MAITIRNTIFIISSLLCLLIGLTTVYGTPLSSDAPKEIRIGANLELSGGIAPYGQSALSGMKLAVNEINASGGVLGYPLRLIIADNRFDKIESAIAMVRLATEENVSAVIGPIASSTCLAVAPIAEQCQIPFISPTSTNPRVTVFDGSVRTYAFRSCFIDPFHGTVMANFASRSIGAKTAAVYIDNSSDYSKSVARVFENEFVSNGGQIVAKETFLQKDTNFTAALTKINYANPDVVFIPGYYEEVGKIIRQARDIGIHVPLLGADGWDSPELVTFAGADALNNAYYSNHYSADDPAPQSQKFVNSYRSENGRTPDALAALGYDAVYMVADAIKRADSTVGTQIASALAQTHNLGGVSGTLTVDSNHNPIKSAVVIQLVNGSQTFYQRILP